MAKRNLVELAFIIILALILIFLLLPRKAQPAETGTLELVQDFGGGEAPEFDKFFLEISKSLTRWWKAEGKSQTSQKWGVFVKLNPLLADSNEGRPVIVVCLINDKEGTAPALAGIVPVTGEKFNFEKAAKTVAKVVAAVILQAEEKTKKSGKLGGKFDGKIKNFSSG